MESSGSMRWVLNPKRKSAHGPRPEVETRGAKRTANSVIDPIRSSRAAESGLSAFSVGCARARAVPYPLAPNLMGKGQRIPWSVEWLAARSHGSCVYSPSARKTPLR